MHETAEDLAELDGLLRASYASAGAHLRRIHTPERRLDAAGVAARLQGMCLLALATTTRDGRPVVGPVDSIFFRGQFVFGTAPDSVRWRHISRRPQVSATHLPGEELAVTVHGRAVEVPVDPERGAELRAALLDTYAQDDAYRELMDSGSVYARIEAERMFAYAAREP